MRQCGKSLLMIATRTVLTGLALGLGCNPVRAQVPLFNGLDWLMDRGQLTFSTVLPSAGNAGIPLRQGGNDFLFSSNALNVQGNGSNDPGAAIRRWVFPRTSDLN